MVKRIAVVIADDQPRARQSLRALLATCPQVGPIREAADGLAALKLADESPPDVVVLDILMPVMDGLEAARSIRARLPQVKLILTSMHGEYQDAALAAGADVFFRKGDPPGELLDRLAALTGAKGAG